MNTHRNTSLRVLLFAGLVVALNACTGAADMSMGTPDGSDDDSGEPRAEGAELVPVGYFDLDVWPSDGPQPPTDEEPRPPVCEEYATELIAAREIDTGSVTVKEEDGELVVRIETEGDWQLDEAHIYVGVGPVPTNDAGNPAPGCFPYQYEPSEGQRVIELRVPMIDATIECGDALVIAVHVVTSNTESGVCETGWAEGPTEFSGSRWGWELGYDVTCCADEGGDPDPTIDLI